MYIKRTGGFGKGCGTVSLDVVTYMTVQSGLATYNCYKVLKKLSVTIGIRFDPWLKSLGRL